MGYLAAVEEVDFLFDPGRSMGNIKQGGALLSYLRHRLVSQYHLLRFSVDFRGLTMHDCS